MSTREEVTEVDHGDVPKGYVVLYHELRGYDSPDRWYTAMTKRGRLIISCAAYNQAVAACKKDKKDKRK